MAVACETADPDGYAANVEPDSAEYNGSYQVTGSTGETSGAPIERSDTASLGKLSERYSFGEMQYMCTEFDSDRQVTVEHIKTLTD